MIGGTMISRVSIAALAAAGVMLSSASAQAADLGGDCCADLEERVATLEATTARKGNRKVSLTIYGQVNQALMVWDNGRDTDGYIVDNDNSSSRFGFKGKAKINSDWSAGYKIEIEVESSSSVGVDETNDDGQGTPALRKSSLYIKSKTFGKLTIGQDSVATDDLSHDTQTSGTSKFVQPDIKYGRDFNLINSAGGNVGTEWGQLCGSQIADGDQCFDIGGRYNVVRYDTPSIAGFKLSAAWGEDDYWDVAARYKGKFDQIKIGAGIGYSEWDGQDAGTNAEETSFVASASIMHKPTGLFVNAAYRNTEVDFGATSQDMDAYYIQAGIKQKWNSLGATTIWGDYMNAQDGLLTGEDRNQTFGGNVAISSEYDRWGLGIAQNIDAAAMQLYLVYQHNEAEIDTVAGAVTGIEDFDVFVAGGVIKF